MNKQIRQLALGLMTLYVVLFATLNYWTVAQEEELNANIENTRAVRREFDRPRGPIVTADGVVAAESVPNPDPDAEFDRLREYPTGDLLSNITGYFTLSFGSTGVERVYGDVLTGTTTEQQIRALGDLLSSDVDNSGTVQLSVRNDLQAAAKFALAGRSGSVVVTEVETGAVRAMYSNPSYDPNTFVNLPFEDAQEAIVDLQNAPGNPLLSGAFQQRYMPGSTFKVITTGIGLENGVIDTTSEFERVSEWVPPQTTDPIENYRGSVCGGDLPEVFRRSCNIPFAQTAILLGPDRMVDGVGDWGIGEALPLDIPGSAASTFGDTTDLDERLPLLGIRGFGQNDDQMVPLHMAMVAGTVANGGRMMEPYVVESTYDHQGRVLNDTDPEVWKTPISAQTAATLTELMTGVTEGEGGTGQSVQLAGGQRFAAKTGTAELGLVDDPDRVHAWMIGFAPLEAPKYAISVVLTDLTSTQADAATGGREAGPILKAMLDYLLTGPGANVQLGGPG
ncbi:peptidoglycan D,D-transpeptidase FtsI family protein [Ilumatobacter nonamiensis]|uniref:peptidoglycan D,D-transpeptidase FtsI family protein n=1 Tax=Ilumatobacter nonamiensis TaxID=467093 RepID=UPI000349D758|nr:penicillin-binding transpeptidase domain-containing protein [Ilumatobacter nonamiensis]